MSDSLIAENQRLRHQFFDATHCASTIAESQGRPDQVLYRCTLTVKGHQGDHHRVGDRHMEQVDASWGENTSTGRRRTMREWSVTVKWPALTKRFRFGTNGWAARRFYESAVRSGTYARLVQWGVRR